MSDREKVYTGITRQKLDRLKSNLRSKGIEPPASDFGTLKGRGVVIDAQYSEQKQTLSLSIKEKPFIVSYGYIWGLIDEEVKRIQ